jgi:hypothetical protein
MPSEEKHVNAESVKDYIHFGDKKKYSIDINGTVTKQRSVIDYFNLTTFINVLLLSVVMMTGWDGAVKWLTDQILNDEFSSMPLRVAVSLGFFIFGISALIHNPRNK